LFHTFHPSGNFSHPERPKGSSLRCPYCESTRLRLVTGAKHR
jgi:hypothetical protein